MQRLSALLVLFGLATTAYPVSAATGSVPNLDVSQSCWGARSYSGRDKDLTYKRCMQDEKAAHDRLVEKWSHFNPMDRHDCVGQGSSSVPSYVEILTCLEMGEYVRAFDNPGDSAARTQGSVPPAAPSESLAGLSR